MAREALKLPGLAHAAKDNDWTPFLNEVAGHCRDQIGAMIRIHDQFYGAGTGTAFFKTGYFKDLPRAIRSRIGSQLDRKIAEAKAIAQTKALSEARAIAQAKARAVAAEKPKQTAKAEVTVKQAEHKPADPSQYRKTVALSVASVEMSKLRSKLYECTDQNVARAGLLQSEIQPLTESVISSCNSDFEAALQSVVNFFKIDAGLDAVTDAQEEMLREEILRVVREHIVSAAMANRKER